MVSNPYFRHELAKKVITLILAVVGLLIIRAIVDNLPMIRHAAPIVLHRKQVLKFGGSNYSGSSANRRLLSKIYSSYTRSLLEGNFSKVFAKGAIQKDLLNHPTALAEMGIIFPVSIANAAVDTLIFLAILTIAQGIRSLMLFSLERFRESGTLVFLSALLVVILWAYNAYGPIALPLLGRGGDIYGWVFLLFGLAPVAGIVVISYQNMDTITNLVFASARTTLSQRCPRCRKPVDLNAEYCGECGLRLKAQYPQVQTLESKKCSKCATENEPHAKFCRNCGGPL